MEPAQRDRIVQEGVTGRGFRSGGERYSMKNELIHVIDNTQRKLKNGPLEGGENRPKLTSILRTSLDI